jgi:hypothetical protein
MRAELEKIREWADSKITSGSEPPWAWFQYMKLRETLDAILGGMAATTTVNLPPREGHQETGLRLVVCNDPQETARRRSRRSPITLPT